MNVTKINAPLLICVLALIVVGCSSTLPAPMTVEYHRGQAVQSLALQNERDHATDETGEGSDSAAQFGAGDKKTASLRRLKSISHAQKTLSSTASWNDMFSEDIKLSVSAEKMPIRDFIHYVFGQLLDINYIIDGEVELLEASVVPPVTVNLASEVTPRELFNLTSQLLIERNIFIKYGDNTFYVYTPGSQAVDEDIVVSIGRSKASVPNTAQKLLQVVSLQYGIKLSTENLLNNMLTASIRPDFEQNALFITGYRAEILRALELIEMLDRPASRGAFIGLVELAYVSSEAFTAELLQLLANEGIEAAVGSPDNKNVSLVPLRQLGAVAVFAANKKLLDRVTYWASIIDVPSQGANEQYFMYNPRYARAVDLGVSLTALFGGASNSDRSGQSAQQGTGNAPSPNRVTGVVSDSFRMVVDERANALIFLTSGSEYQAVLPLLTKLDILPKQVMLDITIAEVSLKDEFKFGVEWAVSQGEVSLTTLGAFGAATVGGMGLAIDGTIDGISAPFNANFLKTNSLVKVLSNPTLMVRDGVTANITVGSDISVIGETVADPLTNERQTTTTEYRKTGVDVTVTPTVNARGIVVMEIQQNISNSVPSSLGASGNPDIFERSISTEVIAESGQTILLGGLISQSSSTADSGAPGLAGIPLFGNLFKAKNDSKDRTELVMLITPRVLDSNEKWDDFRKALKKELRLLTIE